MKETDGGLPVKKMSNVPMAVASVALGLVPLPSSAEVQTYVLNKQVAVGETYVLAAAPSISFSIGSIRHQP